jgi:hypothetical protein
MNDYAEPCTLAPKQFKTYEAAMNIHAWEEAERAATELLQLVARMYDEARQRRERG